MAPVHYVSDYEEVTGKKREDFRDEAEAKVITAEAPEVETKKAEAEEA